MDEAIIIDLFNEALLLGLMIVAVLVTPALITGVLISVLQAATQINEQTLSLVPRLLVMFLTFFLTAPWLIARLIDFSERLIHDIPRLVN